MSQMKELVLETVKLLVEEPDKVEVSEGEDNGRDTLYEVRVAPDDVGRVIGKEGRVINSVRLLAGASAAKSRDRVSVKIVTDD